MGRRGISTPHVIFDELPKFKGTQSPPIKRWAITLRHGFDPELILAAIKGWVEAH